jgi:hypothetical protein
MSPFDINSVVFHFDDFNYGRRSFSIECWNCSDSVIYIFSFYYNFIPLSGCVGMGPSTLLFPGARDVVMAALLLLLL